MRPLGQIPGNRNQVTVLNRVKVSVWLWFQLSNIIYFSFFYIFLVHIVSTILLVNEDVYKIIITTTERSDLVVVLEQLDDDLDVGVVVLDGDDAEDVGRVFSIRLLAVLIGKHQTRVRFLDLHRHFFY